MKRSLTIIVAIVTLGLTFSRAYAQSESTQPRITGLRYVTVMVKDYDEALAWYTGVLGLKKVEDQNFGHGQRWLVVAPDDKRQLGIVLETPNADGSKTDRIGKETNWVFEVADCMAFYDALRLRGVHFIETPKRQQWGMTQAVFEDPYGNIFVAESHPPASTPNHPDSR